MATTYRILGQAPATTQVQTRAFISNKALTSNLATLTTNAVHGITQVGTLVNVQGVDSTFDGTYVIQSIPTTTTFTYVKTATNVSTVAVSPVGTATFTPVSSGFLVTNKVIQNGVATLTTAAHGLTAGDYVAVLIGDTAYDTLSVQIISTPSTTTFSYIVGAPTGATTAVTQGAMGRLSFKADLETVPAASQDIPSTLYVANTSNSPQYFRIALRQAGATLANQYLAYDTVVGANQTIAFTTGISLATTDVITVQASSNLVTFTTTGARIA
jgi:hypothetical protein